MEDMLPIHKQMQHQLPRLLLHRLDMELHQLVDISKPRQALTNNHKDMELHHLQLGILLDNLLLLGVMVVQLQVNNNPKDMLDTTKIPLLQLLAVMVSQVVLLQVVVVVMAKEVKLGVIIKDQATISKDQVVEVEATTKVVVIEVAMEDVAVVATIKVVAGVDITEVDITAVVADLVEAMTIQAAVVGMEVEAAVEIEEVSEVEEVLHVEVVVNQSWVVIIRLKMV